MWSRRWQQDIYPNPTLLQLKLLQPTLHQHHARGSKSDDSSFEIQNAWKSEDGLSRKVAKDTGKETFWLSQSKDGGQPAGRGPGCCWISYNAGRLLPKNYPWWQSGETLPHCMELGAAKCSTDWTDGVVKWFTIYILKTTTTNNVCKWAHIPEKAKPCRHIPGDLWVSPKQRR